MDRNQILEAVRKLGPSSPLELANHLGEEPNKLSYHLRAMARDGQLHAAGVTSARKYSIGKGKPGPTTPQRSKPTRKANGSRPAAERFIPAIDADHGLVIVNGAEPIVFTPTQTEAIATLLALHFE